MPSLSLKPCNFETFKPSSLYSWLKASVGSSLAAFRAGKWPKIMPTAASTPERDRISQPRRKPHPRGVLGRVQVRTRVVLFQGMRRSGWVKTFPRSSLKDPTRVMPMASATCMASEVAAETPVRISALSLAAFITIS